MRTFDFSTFRLLAYTFYPKVRNRVYSCPITSIHAPPIIHSQTFPTFDFQPSDELRASFSTFDFPTFQLSNFPTFDSISPVGRLAVPPSIYSCRVTPAVRLTW